MERIDAFYNSLPEPLRFFFFISIIGLLSLMVSLGDVLQKAWLMGLGFFGYLFMSYWALHRAKTFTGVAWLRVVIYICAALIVMFLIAMVVV